MFWKTNERKISKYLICKCFLKKKKCIDHWSLIIDHWNKHYINKLPHGNSPSIWNINMWKFKVIHHIYADNIYYSYKIYIKNELFHWSCLSFLLHCLVWFHCGSSPQCWNSNTDTKLWQSTHISSHSSISAGQNIHYARQQQNNLSDQTQLPPWKPAALIRRCRDQRSRPGDWAAAQKRSNQVTAVTLHHPTH